MAAIAIATDGKSQVYFADPEPLASDAPPATHAVLEDLDGDGDLDAIIGGVLGDPGPSAGALPFRIYANAGDGTFVDATTNMLGSSFSQPVAQFALGDIDGDGDVDLLVPDVVGSSPDRLFINQGDGTFVDEAGTRLGGASLFADVARFGDLDADGDLDLLVIGGSATGTVNGKIYLNDGAGFFALGAEPPWLEPYKRVWRVDLLDFNRDFALDVLLTDESSVKLWLNHGDATFIGAGAGAFPSLAIHETGAPAVCDLDGDADLDVWLPDRGGSDFDALLMYVGPFAFQDASQFVSGDVPSFDLGAACVDLDDDGGFDVALLPWFGGTGRIFRGQVGAFQNIGGLSQTLDSVGWFDFGDVDGDGRLDALIAARQGTSIPTAIHRGTSEVAIDTRPPRLIALQPAPKPSSPNIIRFAVSDNTVTDAGPRIVQAYVKTESQQIPARYVGGDLFQAMLPEAPSADFAYTACAIDRRGNEACAPPGGAGGGASGSAGAAGASGTAGGGASAAGGSGGASASDSSNQSGCALRSHTPSSRPAWTIALALIVLTLRRSRRGSLRSVESPRPHTR